MVTTIHWLLLERGWIKLNTDGAASSNSSNASIGGLLRDSDANWLCSYSMMLVKDTIFRIEAISILEGLRIAWEKGFKQFDLSKINADQLSESNTSGDDKISETNEIISMMEEIRRWV
ncbi:hypothetical protein PVK06_021832 [Gossypium arboreum]|uniref:RNase H type-1 domain-containing protein n=1 Tax=Gossypium arboreum TaxID=29729 RepID=A0ABR0PRN5_GOSAR|nr:hypothetical protein PVK06_021832 [Gossypium arboreum]